MVSWLNLLLLFCFINYSGTSVVSVTGKNGGNVILSCESEDREITVVKLIRLSENILVCENEECKGENGRVFKEGSCDVIIKDLRLSDAGKYFLRVYYTNDQREVERQIREYHLHIHDEISVKKGEDLKLDVLLAIADKVQRDSNEGWTEVWTRGHGVSSDRLTDRDGNLTIQDFTANDTGTYRALDSEGEVLITVTVTESSTQSKGKLDTDDDHKPSEQPKPWVIGLSVCGGLVILAGIIFAVYNKYQRQHRNTTRMSQCKRSYSSPEHLVMTLDTCNPSEQQICRGFCEH